MHWALVYYPHIDHPAFHRFRNQYEPYARLIPEHVPLVFPVPDQEVDKVTFSAHVQSVLNNWQPFKIHLQDIEKSWDHWMLWSITEGRKHIINLHNDLYRGVLAPLQRRDLPFTPHVALGYFGTEGYDPKNPNASISWEKEKYQQAATAFRSMQLDVWREVDCLTMVVLDDDFKNCSEVERFDLVSGQ